MNDHLSALRLFVRVARKGSFSAGGRELNTPQPTVSRVISALEREVGAALFTRTTRAVTLTDAGADFLVRLEPILAALEEAEHAVRGTGELRGVLRLGLGSTLAIREVVPRLPVFLERHPALRVDLLLDDARQDLVAEGVDIALRFGILQDFDGNGASHWSVAAHSGGIPGLYCPGRRAASTCRPCCARGHPRPAAPPAYVVISQGRQNDVGTRPWAIDGDDQRSLDDRRCRWIGDRRHGAHRLPQGDRRRHPHPGSVGLGYGLDRVACGLRRGRAAKPSARAFAEFLIVGFAN